jgi:hypothetical protein
LIVERTKQRGRDVLAQADSRFEIYAGTQLRKINVLCRVLKMLDKIMVVRRQMIPAASCFCPKSLQTPIHAKNYWPQFQDFFFAAAALAFAAFFLLLLIITIARNEPTTAEPRRVRMTGMRMAQTLGGKKLWSGWPSSTKGCKCQCHVEPPTRVGLTISSVHIV